MNTFISHYAVPLTIAGQLVASAAVSSLPPPTNASKAFYKWFYKFSNTLLANVSALRGKAQYDDVKTVPEEESEHPKTMAAGA